MKRIKILTVMLAVMLAGVCIFGGCSREWEVYTGEVEGGPLYSLEEIYEARAIRWLRLFEYRLPQRGYRAKQMAPAKF